MAQVYGDRWQLIDRIGGGGQGEVFRVIDRNHEFDGELALKRILNPKRRHRFESEVEAIKRLDHKNVVKLIDHSALEMKEALGVKQFLVMPLAQQDLSKRVALYKNNIDSVLDVSSQLCNGLQAAHQSGVIHRDVKPANILFPSDSHEVWLADFGICLIRENLRQTPTPEVVGPVQFMAPELEAGGHLEVTNAADIYSLGKVIYYMLSGGVIIPRERLSDPSYSALFEIGGERRRLLKYLLSRMICSLDNRVKKIEEIQFELQRINDWEKNATAIALTPSALQSLAALQTKASQAFDTRERSRLALDIHNETLAEVEMGVLAWIELELKKAADLAGQEGIIQSGVRSGVRSQAGLNGLRTSRSVEIYIKETQSSKEHILRFSFAVAFKVSVRTHIGPGRPPPPPPIEQHSDVSIFGSYALSYKNEDVKDTSWHFFEQSGGLYKRPVQQSGFRPPQRSNPMLTSSQQPPKVRVLHFSTLDWPNVDNHLREYFNYCFERFFAVVNGSM